MLRISVPVSEQLEIFDRILFHQLEGYVSGLNSDDLVNLLLWIRYYVSNKFSSPGSCPNYHLLSPQMKYAHRSSRILSKVKFQTVRELLIGSWTTDSRMS